MLDLTSSLYGNPHSQNPSSRLSADAIDHVRDLVLAHFGTTAQEYDVIFTSGCTGALKLVGEIFPWAKEETEKRKPGCPQEVVYIDSRSISSVAKGCSSCASGLYDPDGQSSRLSTFAYLEDNHTSVLGIRELAVKHSNSRLVCVTKDAVVDINSNSSTNAANGERTACNTNHWDDQDHSDADRCVRKNGPFHLFAYPAQSNFSGYKYPLSWTYQIQNRKVAISGLERMGGEWLVLLDAAAFVATNPLNLSLYPADFVTVSFYKLFGYPTGVGALLVRRTRVIELTRSYFGGGTVQVSIARKRFHVPRIELHERQVHLVHVVYSFGQVLVKKNH